MLHDFLIAFTAITLWALYSDFAKPWWKNYRAPKGMASVLSSPAPRLLTVKQEEALEWAARGYSNREIGERLGVTEQTIKFHLSAAYERLEVKNRTSAIRKARELGVLA